MPEKTATSTKPDLLELIRQSMKKDKAPQESKQHGKGVQKAKQQPRTDTHGKVGDFTRSNSNPISRNTGISTSARVGSVDVSEAGDDSVRALIRLSLTNTGHPSKAAVKRMAAPKMTRLDRIFQSGKGCGPGSSKSTVIDAIKAINSPNTGCLVREQMKDKGTKELLKPISLTQSQRNANTTQGNYNEMIVKGA